MSKIQPDENGHYIGTREEWMALRDASIKEKRVISMIDLSEILPSRIRKGEITVISGSNAPGPSIEFINHLLGESNAD